MKERWEKSGGRRECEEDKRREERWEVDQLQASPAQATHDRATYLA